METLVEGIRHRRRSGERIAGETQGIAPKFWHKEEWKEGRLEGWKGDNTASKSKCHKDQVKRFKACVAPIQCLKWRWFP